MKRTHRALCAAVFALMTTAAAARAEQPLATAQEMPPASAPSVAPAKANEGPTTLGPLPVVKKDAKANDDSDESFTTVGAGEIEQESLAGTLLRMVLVLGVVVGVIYLSLNHGLRKLMGVRGMPAGRSSLVKVIERVPLDPKRSLFVIQAAGEYLLVGGGEDGLSLLSKLDTAEVERHLAQRQQNAARPSPFLQKLLSRAAPATPKSEAPATPPSETNPPPAEKV